MYQRSSSPDSRSVLTTDAGERMFTKEKKFTLHIEGHQMGATRIFTNVTQHWRIREDKMKGTAITTGEFLETGTACGSKNAAECRHFG